VVKGDVVHLGIMHTPETSKCEINRDREVARHRTQAVAHDRAVRPILQAHASDWPSKLCQVIFLTATFRP
jgi:hypothetical protein